MINKMKKFPGTEEPFELGFMSIALEFLYKDK